MKLVERATPVAAVVAAISTLACCLPLSFLGAIGLAGAGVWLFPVKRWFVAGALVFLVIGFVQLYRRRGQNAQDGVRSALRSSGWPQASC